MKIVLVSNYFNHHQRPLSDALCRLTEDSFYFIETMPMRQERRELGYGWDDLPDYVVTAYRSEHDRQRSMELILDADAVIAGSAPEAYLKQRIREGKLIFRYSERPLKQGPEPLKYIPRLLRWNLRNPAGKPIYLLAASAYAAGDYARFRLFRNRAYRWGYFPETKNGGYPSKKEEKTILWVGRFLDWKHPDDAVRAALKLKDEGCVFRLCFVGTGQMEQQLHSMVKDLGLEAYVSFLGSMKPEQVREHMERASVFLFTSDQQEGWGAVVNEAMNSGCAVVASHAAGCVPYLLKDGENGLIYQSGNVDMLVQKIRVLLEHPDECSRMGQAARETILNTWNAETAAQRLIALSEHILAGEICPDIYRIGPCSRAE